MRQKRAKSYKKQMNLYLHTFKFREPFQTIVDDELVLTCDKASFDLTKGLNRTIQGETKPMITQCCMQALYSTNNQRAIETAKQFERRRCNHPPKDPKPPAECIESIVNIDGVNKHRYIVASQSIGLRKRLRGVPGVPLIFMNRSVMVMEPASSASQRAAAMHENAKLTAGLNDSKVGYVEKDAPENERDESRKKKKRKGPSEPNPLSIKKKKAEPKPEPKEQKKKRSRRHKKASDVEKALDNENANYLGQESAAQNEEKVLNKEEGNEITKVKDIESSADQNVETTEPVVKHNEMEQEDSLSSSS